MQILSRYIAKQVASATAVVLIGFTFLDMLFRMIDELDNVEKDYTPVKAILFELLKTPETLYNMMPMVGLIGCLAGLGALANTSELVVMRSAGISTTRLVVMAIKPAMLFLFASLLVGEYVAPEATRMADVMRETARKPGAEIDVKRGLWLRDGDSFVSINLSDGSGTMFGVNIFNYDQSGDIESLYSIEQATFNGDHWLLENVKITDIANVAATTVSEGDKSEASNKDAADSLPQVIQSFEETLRWQSKIKPEILILSAVRYPDRLGMESLWFYIQYLQEQGLNHDEHSLAFWKKAFYPLVMLSLVLVGISFVFGPLREVTMGYRLFTGILVGVLFKTFQDALSPMSIVFGFSPVLAMLIPGLVSALFGFWLLSRVK